MKALWIFAKDLFTTSHLLLRSFQKVLDRFSIWSFAYDRYFRSFESCILFVLINFLVFVFCAPDKNKWIYSCFYLAFSVLSFCFFGTKKSALVIIERGKIREEETSYKIAKGISIAYFLWAFVLMWMSVFKLI
tara:strand:+ start:117437 stop:117835 length:399 start_codon:yes stop_codon:yes gene_type:complete